MSDDTLLKKVATWLFYQEQHSNTQYTDIPTGQPNISLLLDGRSDFWEKDTIVTKPKPKKLVVADWRLAAAFQKEATKSRLLLAEVQYILSQLEEVGFEIYLYQYKDEIKKITADDLFCNCACLATRPITIADVNKLMGEKGIASDQLLVLDPINMEMLVHGYVNETLILDLIEDIKLSPFLEGELAGWFKQYSNRIMIEYQEDYYEKYRHYIDDSDEKKRESIIRAYNNFIIEIKEIYSKFEITNVSFVKKEPTVIKEPELPYRKHFKTREELDLAASVSSDVSHKDHFSLMNIEDLIVEEGVLDGMVLGPIARAFWFCRKRRQYASALLMPVKQDVTGNTIENKIVYRKIKKITIPALRRFGISHFSNDTISLTINGFSDVTLLASILDSLNNLKELIINIIVLHKDATACSRFELNKVLEVIIVRNIKTLQHLVITVAKGSGWETDVMLKKLLDTYPNLSTLIIKGSDFEPDNRVYCYNDENVLEMLADMSIEEGIIGVRTLGKSLHTLFIENDLTQVTAKLINIRRPWCNIIGFRDRWSNFYCSRHLHSSSLSSLVSSSCAGTHNKIVDYDTTPRDVTFSIQQVFWGLNTSDPAPNYYRELVYTEQDVANPFKLICTFDENDLCNLGIDNPNAKPVIVLETTDVYNSSQHMHKKDTNVYYAKKSLFLTHNWQALPSLHPEEIITRMHLDNISVANVTIKYNAKHRLYYIKITDEFPVPQGPTAIDLFLLTPADKPEIQDVKIKEIIDVHRKFEAKALSNIIDISSPREILQQIRNERVGACRHRAVSFKDSVQQLGSPVPEVCVIRNTCHMYVEIFADGRWIQVDLGGYPGTLNIDPSSAPRNHSTMPITMALTENPITNNSIPFPRFATWETRDVSMQYTNSLEFLEAQVLGEHDGIPLGRNRLITCGVEQAKALQLSLQLQCNKVHKPVFYINAFDELRCQQPKIEIMAGGIVKISDGPSGQLYDFLQGDTKRVLIINWNNFSSAEIVRANSVLDVPGTIDDISIPVVCSIIGLYDPLQESAYRGSDFYSRFDSQISCSFSFDLPSLIQDRIRKVSTLTSSSSSSSSSVALSKLTVDLCDSTNWRSILFGSLEMCIDKLIYHPSSFVMALAGEPAVSVLAILNGPWWQEDFSNFWQQALLHNSFYLYGKDYALHESFCIERASFIDWSILSSDLVRCELFTASSLQKELYILNRSTLSQFLRNYTCNESGGLDTTLPGWLQQHKEKEKVLLEQMPLLVTSSLSSHEWFKLLTAARKHQVSLCLYVAPYITIPQELADQMHYRLEDASPTVRQTQDMPYKIVADMREGTAQILSEVDADWFVDQLMQVDDPIDPVSSQDAAVAAVQKLAPIMLDVTDFTPKHLFSSLTTVVAETARSTANIEIPKFICNCNALLTLLQEGQIVILHGDFSIEVVEHLASLCGNPSRYYFNGKSYTHKGKLLIIPKDIKPFSFAPITSCLTIPKLSQVLAGDSLEEKTKKYSYIQKKSIELLQAEDDPEQIWQGMKEIAKYPEEPIDVNIFAEDKTLIFEKHRSQQLLDRLRKFPHVVVAGISGTGKSTFIQEVLLAINGDQISAIYFAEQEAGERNWVLSDTSDGKLSILFIDEANIAKGNFARFDSLFNDPPIIVLDDGKKYILSKNHKVIFAGNPLNYGGRNLPSFFVRHGGSIIFNPLPTNYIHYKLLQPILSASLTPLTEEWQNIISTKILYVYQYICRISTSHILISPRELQMMALLTLQNPEQANNYIHMLAQSVIPGAQQAIFSSWFQEHIGMCQQTAFVTNIKLENAVTKTKFLITASRATLYQQTCDLLLLREFRRTTQLDICKYAGLGGMILEGLPAVGKSDFIMQVLLANGFCERKLDDKITEAVIVSGKYFYRLPVKFSTKIKERFLLKAWDEGAIVIIDEINSCPMMENILNALLMGRDLLANRRPKVPGFLLFGTQNPITMGAREAMSTALQRRLLSVQVLAYPREEMVEILEFYGLVQARQLVEEFLSACSYAAIHNKKPAPTFRNLIKHAQLLINRGKLMPDEQVEQQITDGNYLSQYTILPGATSVITTAFNTARPIEATTDIRSLEQKRLSC